MLQASSTCSAHVRLPAQPDMHRTSPLAAALGKGSRSMLLQGACLCDCSFSSLFHMQGQYGDAVYAYVEAEIVFNMTSLDDDPETRALMYAGIYMQWCWQLVCACNCPGM